MGRIGLHERGDRDGTRGLNGNGKESHAQDLGQAGSQEQSERDLHRRESRLAFDRLRGEEVDPFPTLPLRVKARAERLTGRTLEESYEGFTNLVANAIMEISRDDSRPARKRGRRL